MSSDLEWDYDDLPAGPPSSNSYSWNFNCFMEEYNRLYGFLNKMHESSSPSVSVSSALDRHEKRYQVGIDFKRYTT